MRFQIKQLSKVTYNLKEGGMILLGGIILIFSTPFIFPMIGSFLLTKIDNCFQKDGVSFSQRVANHVNKVSKKYFLRVVRFQEDYYFINWIILLGIAIPSIFALAAFHTYQFGFSYLLWIVYHSIRLGPNQIFASWLFALAHKEAHMSGQIYTNKYIKIVLDDIYNWFIGVFYGLVPQSTYYGHVLNHHKYDNRQDDLISSSDRPRDSIINYIKYVPRFTGYSLNLSTIVQFTKEKHYGMVFKIILGTIYWISLIFITAYCFGFKFSIGYILYPMIETNFIFTGFAWGWHAFIDAEDPENEFINSVTIVDGEFNDLNEGYHVVHHQYPGVHWSFNKQMFEKHLPEYYQGNQATMFKSIESYQLFLLIIFKRYDIMAEKMANREDLNIEQKKEFLKSRLNTCTWGPLKNTNQKRIREQ